MALRVLCDGRPTTDKTACLSRLSQVKGQARPETNADAGGPKEWMGTNADADDWRTDN